MTDTAPDPKKKKRLPLWGWFAAGFVIFLVLAIVVLRVIAGTSIGRNMLESQLEGMTIQEQTIEFDGLEGDLLDRITLDKLTLRDSDGVWAEGQDLVLDWSPMALISRKVNVDLIEAGSIDVLRRPILPPSEEKDKSSSGEMPLKGIKLSELNLKRISLAEGVVPTAVAGSVTGEGVWTPEMADLNIQLEPEDQDGDRLVGRVNWTDNTPLKGHVELNGPAGGLFATLLRLEPEQSVTADFDAEGEMSAVDASLIARINQSEWLSLTITPDGDLHAFNADIDLSLHPDGIVAAERLGRSLNLSGELDLQNPVETLDFVASARVATLALTNVRQTDGKISATVDLRSSDPDSILQTDAASIEAIAVQGDMSLIDGIVLLDGRLQVDRLRTSQASVERVAGPVLVRYGEDRIEISPDWRAEKLVFNLRDEPTRVDWLTLKSEASFGLTNSLLRLANTEIRTRNSFIRASGDSTIQGALPTNVKGDVRVNLAEFGLYDAGLIEGSWAAVRRSDNRSRFSADLRGTQLAETEELYEWLGEQISLKLDGSLTDEGALDIPNFRLAVASGVLTGSAKRSATGVLDANASLMTGDQYPLAEMLPGAQIELSARGPMERIELTSRATALYAKSGEFTFDDPNIVFDGVWADAVLTGATQLGGQVEGEPVQLATDIRLDGTDWSLSDLDGSWRDLTVNGQVSGAAGDIETIAGEMRLVGDLPEDLPAKSVDLNFYRAQGDLRVAGKVLDITTGPFESSDLTLDVSGTVERAIYDLKLDGLMTLAEITQDTTLSLSGEAHDLLTDQRATNGLINVEWGRETLETRSPFRLQQSPKGVEGEVLLRLLKGDIDLVLKDAPEERVRLTVGEITLANVMQALGRASVEGSTEFNLVLKENGEHLIGDIEGALRDLALPDESMTPVSFLVSGQIRDEALGLELVTPEEQVFGATINVALPLETGIAPISLRVSDRELGKVTAQLAGRIDNIMALVLADQMAVRGSIDANFSAPIPFEPSGLDGQIVMTDGYFEHGELGAVFQDINFTVNVADQMLALDEFSALGRKGGTLTGYGSMGLLDQSGSNIEITADKLVVVDRREGRAVATGTLGLNVEDEAFVVTGDLTLDEGQIYIDRLPSAGVTTLDVQFPTGNGSDVSEEEDSRAVRLDIALKAPRRLRVDGSGMDAEMSLDSKITGSLDNLQINGVSRIVRGRFELLGKRFTFTESDITFAGDPMMARLDIEAQRDAGDFLAKVSITGTPERPKVTLDAEPSLPEDEVLSRVLFGRSPSQLTGLEAARLAAALAQMGGGGGFDLMGGIEAIAGLDTFDVSQDSSGQFQVATGRYLSEDVYLEVSSNASGSPGVSVEWEPRENISVGAETVPGEGQNFSIQWKRDFE